MKLEVKVCVCVLQKLELTLSTESEYHTFMEGILLVGLLTDVYPHEQDQ